MTNATSHKTFDYAAAAERLKGVVRKTPLQYNQRLSQRRAQSVASYLRSKGVGQNAIQTAAFGETRPRVPTADGVRNEENRRAELFLRK